MGLALWLVPPPSEAKLLKQLMCLPPSLDSLSATYRLSSFEPHITIASFSSSIPLEKIRSTVSLLCEGSDERKPLRVEFTALSVGDAYFRSVFMDVAPTDALCALHQRVQRELAEYNPRSPRFPHMSLFYIPDEHASDRMRVREAVWAAYGVPLAPASSSDAPGLPEPPSRNGSVTKSRTEDHDKKDFERIAFDLNDDGNGKQRLDGFHAEEVWVVSCEGPVEEWSVLCGDKIKLFKNDQ